MWDGPFPSPSPFSRPPWLGSGEEGVGRSLSLTLPLLPASLAGEWGGGCGTVPFPHPPPSPGLPGWGVGRRVWDGPFPSPSPFSRPPWLGSGEEGVGRSLSLTLPLLPASLAGEWGGGCGTVPFPHPPPSPGLPGWGVGRRVWDGPFPSPSPFSRPPWLGSGEEGVGRSLSLTLPLLPASLAGEWGGGCGTVPFPHPPPSPGLPGWGVGRRVWDGPFPSPSPFSRPPWLGSGEEGVGRSLSLTLPLLPASLAGEWGGGCGTVPFPHPPPSPGLPGWGVGRRVWDGPFPSPSPFSRPPWLGSGEEGVGRSLSLTLPLLPASLAGEWGGGCGTVPFPHPPPSPGLPGWGVGRRVWDGPFPSPSPFSRPPWLGSGEEGVGRSLSLTLPLLPASLAGEWGGGCGTVPFPHPPPSPGFPGWGVGRRVWESPFPSPSPFSRLPWLGSGEEGVGKSLSLTLPLLPASLAGEWGGGCGTVPFPHPPPSPGLPGWGVGRRVWDGPFPSPSPFSRPPWLGSGEEGVGRSLSLTLPLLPASLAGEWGGGCGTVPFPHPPPSPGLPGWGVGRRVWESPFPSPSPFSRLPWLGSGEEGVGKSLSLTLPLLPASLAGEWGGGCGKVPFPHPPPSPGFPGWGVGRRVWESPFPSPSPFSRLPWLGSGEEGVGKSLSLTLPLLPASLAGEWGGGCGKVPFPHPPPSPGFPGWGVGRRVWESPFPSPSPFSRLPWLGSGEEGVGKSLSLTLPLLPASLAGEWGGGCGKVPFPHPPPSPGFPGWGVGRRVWESPFPSPSPFSRLPWLGSGEEGVGKSLSLTLPLLPASLAGEWGGGCGKVPFPHPPPSPGFPGWGVGRRVWDGPFPSPSPFSRPPWLGSGEEGVGRSLSLTLPLLPASLAGEWGGGCGTVPFPHPPPSPGLPGWGVGRRVWDGPFPSPSPFSRPPWLGSGEEGVGKSLSLTLPLLPASLAGEWGGGCGTVPFPHPPPSPGLPGWGVGRRVWDGPFPSPSPFSRPPWLGSGEEGVGRSLSLTLPLLPASLAGEWGGGCGTVPFPHPPPSPGLPGWGVGRRVWDGPFPSPSPFSRPPWLGSGEEGVGRSLSLTLPLLPASLAGEWGGGCGTVPFPHPPPSPGLPGWGVGRRVWDGPFPSPSPFSRPPWLGSGEEGVGRSLSLTLPLLPASLAGEWGGGCGTVPFPHPPPSPGLPGWGVGRRVWESPFPSPSPFSRPPWLGSGEEGVGRSLSLTLPLLPASLAGEWGGGCGKVPFPHPPPSPGFPGWGVGRRVWESPFPSPSPFSRLPWLGSGEEGVGKSLSLTLPLLPASLAGEWGGGCGKVPFPHPPPSPGFPGWGVGRRVWDGPFPSPSPFSRLPWLGSGEEGVGKSLSLTLPLLPASLAGEWGGGCGKVPFPHPPPSPGFPGWGVGRRVWESPFPSPSPFSRLPWLGSGEEGVGKSLSLTLPLLPASLAGEWGGGCGKVPFPHPPPSPGFPGWGVGRRVWESPFPSPSPFSRLPWLGSGEEGVGKSLSLTLPLLPASLAGEWGGGCGKVPFPHPPPSPGFPGWGVGRRVWESPFPSPSPFSRLPWLGSGEEGVGKSLSLTLPLLPASLAGEWGGGCGKVPFPHPPPSPGFPGWGVGRRVWESPFPSPSPFSRLPWLGSCHFAMLTQWIKMEIVR